MKMVKQLSNGLELNLNYALSKSTGYGHKKITVELEYKGNFKQFSATTTNMPAFDKATDLEGYEKAEALYNIISYSIEDQVEEWIIELDNE